jgi:hypothetical protein
MLSNDQGQGSNIPVYDSVSLLDPADEMESFAVEGMPKDPI